MTTTLLLNGNTEADLLRMRVTELEASLDAVRAGNEERINELRALRTKVEELERKLLLLRSSR